MCRKIYSLRKWKRNVLLSILYNCLMCLPIDHTSAEIVSLATKFENLWASWHQGFFLKADSCTVHQDLCHLFGIGCGIFQHWFLWYPFIHSRNNSQEQHWLHRGWGCREATSVSVILVTVKEVHIIFLTVLSWSRALKKCCPVGFKYVPCQLNQKQEQTEPAQHKQNLKRNYPKGKLQFINF